MSEQPDEGVLAELPTSIAYVKEAGIIAGRVATEDLEDNQELTAAIAEIFSRHFEGISRDEGVRRLKEDEALLWDWLQKYPSERFPETLGLYTVIGSMHYLDYIFDRRKR